MKEERCIHTHSGWGGDKGIKSKVVSWFGFKRFKNKSDLVRMEIMFPSQKEVWWQGVEMEARFAVLFGIGRCNFCCLTLAWTSHHQSLPLFNVAPRIPAFSSTRREILGRSSRSSTQHIFYITIYIHKYTHIQNVHTHSTQTCGPNQI